MCKLNMMESNITAGSTVAWRPGSDASVSTVKRPVPVPGTPYGVAVGTARILALEVP